MAPLKDTCDALTLESVTEGVDIPEPPAGMTISDLRNKIQEVDLNLELEMHILVNILGIMTY